MDELRDKIKDSEVKVEIDSQNSNLADALNKIRSQYDKLAKRNLKETEEWYETKVSHTVPPFYILLSPLPLLTSHTSYPSPQFDNIKVVEAQNCEALQSGKSELRDLLKQKQVLEIQIQSQQSKVNSHHLGQSSSDSLLRQSPKIFGKNLKDNIFGLRFTVAGATTLPAGLSVYLTRQAFLAALSLNCLLATSAAKMPHKCSLKIKNQGYLLLLRHDKRFTT